MLLINHIVVRLNHSTKKTRRQWYYSQQKEAEEGRKRRREAYEQEHNQHQEHDQGYSQDHNQGYNQESNQQEKIYDTKQEEYCKLLGISINATNKEIDMAWRKCCMIYHPDRNPDRWDWANTMMCRINEAYEHVLLWAK